MSIKSANKFLNPLESDDVGHVKIAKIVKKNTQVREQALKHLCFNIRVGFKDGYRTIIQGIDRQTCNIKCNVQTQ